jgi:hypothetical protein
MKKNAYSSLAALGLVVSLFVSGCFVAAPAESEVSWAIKAATNNLTEATAGEWQALAEKIDEFVPEVEVSLTDEQAEAIVEFVQANDIDGVQDIQDLIEQAQSDPDSITIPDGFEELFAGMAEADFDDLVGTLQG